MINEDWLDEAFDLVFSEITDKDIGEIYRDQHEEDYKENVYQEIGDFNKAHLEALKKSNEWVYKKYLGVWKKKDPDGLKKYKALKKFGLIKEEKK